jgi:transcriptional regulator GlxA family with amidase domain
MKCRLLQTSMVVLLAVTLVFAASQRVAAADNPAAADTPPAKPAVKATRTLGIVLYPRFELLDAYGPAEVFGNLAGRLKVVTVAQKAGPVASTQGPQGVADYSFEDCPPLDLVLVPGGFGTLAELKNEALLQWLRTQAESAEIVMSVCSGSSLLAQAGLLDGRRATSNKQYFKFATDRAPQVQWVKQARWVDDGNRVTSSGVSAGIDMSLHVIERLWGTETAERIANATEYQWHRDADVDPFAKFAK